MAKTQMAGTGPAMGGISAGIIAIGQSSRDRARHAARISIWIGPSARPLMNWSTYGLPELSISVADPIHTMRPPCSIAIRSAILRALAISWVIDTAVAP